MRRLGLPEIAGRRDLGDDLAGPEARGIDVSDDPKRFVALRLGKIKDLRAIRRPDIVALAVRRGGVVDLKEKLQNVAVSDARRVELDLDALGVAAMVAVCAEFK